MRRFAVSACILLSASLPVQAAVCRVTPNGSTANDGTTWARAMNLRKALNTATCTEIWIRRGVHVPTPTGGAEPHFTVPPNVKLYGGFAGTETELGQRRPGTNRSVLSGDLDGDDVVDANGITLRYQDIVGLNTCPVVRMESSGAGDAITQATVLNGLVVTAGRGADPDSCSGAGVRCDAYAGGICSPTLANVLFAGNHGREGAGAHISVNGDGGVADPVIVNSRFRGNRAEHDGGGVLLESYSGGSVLGRVENVTFIDNEAGWNGGGLSIVPWSYGLAQTLVKGAVFDGNQSERDGGGMSFEAWGGGSGSFTLERSSLRRNHSVQSGGGLFVHSWSDGASEGVVRDTTFHDNASDLGGGGLANHAWGLRTITSLVNVTFDGNRALRDGGAIENAATDASTANVTATHATIRGNHAVWSGGGIHDDPDSSGTSLTKIELINTIVWDNAADDGPPEMSYASSSQLVVRRSILQQGCPPTAAPCNVVAGDPRLGPLAHNGGPTATIHPRAGSVAIDRANATYCTDLDQRGEPRPFGAECDIGAVEDNGDLLFADGFELL